MDDLQILLEISARDHDHLCPRQILGARLGLMGLKSLGFEERSSNKQRREKQRREKQLLVITETDGCFVDGLTAATGCTVGHRTLRVEDYGKTAAVFVDTVTGRAVRVSPQADIRQKADLYASNETRHYFAMLRAYQVMPDEVMFNVVNVELNTTVAEIVSRPGLRVNCDCCGEEIMNAREVKQGEHTLCRACAQGAYYRGLEVESVDLFTIAAQRT